jgi:hypothetical protein
MREHHSLLYIFTLFGCVLTVIFGISAIINRGYQKSKTKNENEEENLFLQQW